MYGLDADSQLLTYEIGFVTTTSASGRDSDFSVDVNTVAFNLQPVGRKSGTLYCTLDNQ